MEQWFQHMKKADFDAVARDFSIDKVTARLIRNRDIVTPEEIKKYLHATVDELYSPFLMKDMDKAIRLIMETIKNHKKIRVIGDYDIDGVCSTYILVSGLKKLSADVDYAIPNRIKDGYGLNIALVEEAISDKVDLIITCDNGISAYDQIAYAVQHGVQVIVTDHHEIPFDYNAQGEKVYKIPNADAVIDPKQEACTYPFKEICGCVVAWKVITALFSEAGEHEPDDYLEIAAFATIGDVMELKDENRIIVKYGLKKMPHTTNQGLKALIDVNQLSGKDIAAYHVGFVLGPCMNATGRLDSAIRALRMLLCTKRNEAIEIASELKELNDSRKDMTLKNTALAIAQIEESALLEDKVLVVYLSKCHESLAGIIAGRLREKYDRPSFVLTDSEEGVKGSGRSIEAYDMYEELNKCKDLLTKFGGHKMAAGVSLKKENVDKLRRALNENTVLKQEDLVNRIYIDMELPMGYVTQDLIQEFDLLEPFGNANPKPVFALRNLKFMSMNVFGKAKNVVRFSVQEENGGIKARHTLVYFGNIDEFSSYIEERFSEEQLEKLLAGKPNDITLSVLYYPSINEYMGKKQIQFVMQGYK